jgi:hypothetical protein
LRLPPRCSCNFLPFLPRCGAIIFPRRPLVASGSSEQRRVFLLDDPPASFSFFLGAVLLFPLFFISTLLFPVPTTLLRKFPRSPILPRALRTFFPFYLGAPPRPRTSPSRLVLLFFLPSCSSAASRFLPGAETPPRPITEGVSLRPPIGAEQAFPARGMLTQFPHTFAGGASRPRRVLRSGHFLPGGQMVSSHFPPPPIRKRNSRGGADVTCGTGGPCRCATAAGRRASIYSL